MYSSLRTFQLEQYQMNNLILYKYNNMKRNKKQGIEKQLQMQERQLCFSLYPDCRGVEQPI